MSTTALPAGLPAGMFVAPRIEERSIELADGSTHVMWFRTVPNSVMERYVARLNSEDEGVSAQAVSWVLARVMCDAEGNDVLSVEQADLIDRAVARRLFVAAMEVNGFGSAAKAVAAAAAGGDPAGES
jgi:hypothetical protein